MEQTTLKAIIDLTIATLTAQGVFDGEINQYLGYKPPDSALPICNVTREVNTCEKITSGPTYTRTETLAIFYEDINEDPKTVLEKVNTAYEDILNALFEDPVWNSPARSNFSAKSVKAEFGTREATKGQAFIASVVVNIALTYTAHYTMRLPTAQVTEIEHTLHTDGVDRITQINELSDPAT